MVTRSAVAYLDNAVSQPSRQGFIPPNFLNNDTYFIDVALTFLKPGVHVSFHERSALSVVTIDPMDETLYSVGRNGYAGAVSGIVRPHIQSEIPRLP